MPGTRRPAPGRGRGVDWGVLAAVAAGGALGAPARYGIAQLVTARAGSFPWATFCTNVSGSFALGIVVVVLAGRFASNRHLRPFLCTGFLSAYTTFSTFAVETDLLVKEGRPAPALLYVASSLVVGLAAAGAGMAVGRRVIGVTGRRPGSRT